MAQKVWTTKYINIIDHREDISKLWNLCSIHLFIIELLR